MHLYQTLHQEILRIIQVLVLRGDLPAGMDVSKVDVSPPKDSTHGDAATNAAMVLAAQASKKPKEIADLLLPEMAKASWAKSVAVAGPGFINIHLQNSLYQDVLKQILSDGLNWGQCDIGAGVRVNVEYVSANPTGPMHVGHARGAVFGDVLARLLSKAGYAVTKEYYVNDAGTQVGTLAQSVFLRYREVLGEAIGEIPAGMYPGEYLIPVAQQLAEQYGNKLLEMKEIEREPLIRKVAIDAMMQNIRNDLQALGITHDVFTFESEITAAGLVDKALQELDKKGLLYQGVLEPPKGKAPDDWEPREQTLFRSTQFGDDCDRAVRKSDGSWTYFAPDIAYHYDKVRRGHTRLIDVFGADHGGYVKRIAASVAALTDGKATVEVKICQLVKFMRGGQPAKMSKRSGTFVLARDVVDEVGKDVLRQMMVMRKNDVPLDFDFDKVMEQSKDNPVFYVQYAHARVCSVLRNMAEQMPQIGQGNPANIAKLSHPQEYQLMRNLASFPRLVEQAAMSGEPHRIAFYLYDLAGEFHALWNSGSGDAALRFIIPEDEALTSARACLLRGVRYTLASGLDVMGVAALEKM